MHISLRCVDPHREIAIKNQVAEMGLVNSKPRTNVQASVGLGNNIGRVKTGGTSATFLAAAAAAATRSPIWLCESLQPSFSPPPPPIPVPDPVGSCLVLSRTRSKATSSFASLLTPPTRGVAGCVSRERSVSRSTVESLNHSSVRRSVGRSSGQPSKASTGRQTSGPAGRPGGRAADRHRQTTP